MKREPLHKPRKHPSRPVGEAPILPEEMRPGGPRDQQSEGDEATGREDARLPGENIPAVDREDK